MEWLLAFIFLPTIMHVLSGKGRKKLNDFTIQTIDDILDSIEVENKDKSKE